MPKHMRGSPNNNLQKYMDCVQYKKSNSVQSNTNFKNSTVRFVRVLIKKSA